jgi:hypothetical protein
MKKAQGTGHKEGPGNKNQERKKEGTRNYFLVPFILKLDLVS